MRLLLKTKINKNNMASTLIHTTTPIELKYRKKLILFLLNGHPSIRGHKETCCFSTLFNNNSFILSKNLFTPVIKLKCNRKPFDLACQELSCSIAISLRTIY